MTTTALWRRTTPATPGRRALVVLATAVLVSLAVLVLATVLAAPAAGAPLGPDGPVGPGGPEGGASVTVDLDGLTGEPGTPVIAIIGLTLLSLLPAILLTCTSFTKILVVLGLTRNALGLQQTPPNQVLAGLALFLSLFIMAPVLTAINDAGLQPYLAGDLTASQAFDVGIEPLRDFMLDQTGDDELRLLTSVADRELPATRADVPLTTLIPAFVLSELKAAFIIGFVIFVPFLVIDIVVSGALMALGMMMMPPVMVSLPFKLLLFVLVDGWALIIRALVSSYGGGG
ncbi:flagellar biosynthetic protein FliP [Nocardioides massiliensis]|uniref:Flagellar biosynthetic protein FliP n=1 Tax=Nocardioides massiliensis TaxID=1325935 RepID=A0ABT9NMQ3_9ACTN|nr:flagellar type III secretion system pore protein FliP [Nocardioides massiliensis]MDP9821697.1 flagellar biosynthetic protein FliP [Nocardioides massiliensis]